MDNFFKILSKIPVLQQFKALNTCKNCKVNAGRHLDTNQYTQTHSKELCANTLLLHRTSGE